MSNFRLWIAITFVLCASVPAFAQDVVQKTEFRAESNRSTDFLHAIDILDPTAIAQLSNTQLSDVYADVLVEIEADRAFHTSGYTRKEFLHFKDLLKYKINLIREFQKREMEVPQFSI